MRHNIELKLSSAGFSAEEIGQVLPDFMTERKTLVGLTWYPCAEGPERFVLVVTVYAVIGAVAKVFLEELSKDLYKWIKLKVNMLLKKKPQAFGMMLIKFEDAEIEFWTSGGESWEELANILSEILEQIKPAEAKNWSIELRDEKFILRNLDAKKNA